MESMREGAPAGPDAPDLLPVAELIDQQLLVIRRLIVRAFEADVARLNLTMPQYKTLGELFKEDGLRLSVLSARLGLAHSTVSSLVDRLERRGFIERRPDPQDHRASRLFLTEKVRTYQRERMPQRRFGPLLVALQRAEAGERATILDGLATLRRLLETPAHPEGESL